MPDIRALDSTTLFAASDWMRRLARHLIHDDDRADDLVQEAWQAALRNPPRQHVPLRPWLGGILKRKAREAHRSLANRSAREERAAAPEAQPSTAELAACAEEQRYLIGCVLALPEKYREVLLLRFYEDLPPRIVAERLSLPVNTVQTQAQRGLERLRAKLDERHQGDRRAWGMLLLPLAAESASPPVSPTLESGTRATPILAHSMGATWRWVALVAILVGGAILVRLAGGEDEKFAGAAPNLTGLQQGVSAIGGAPAATGELASLSAVAPDRRSVQGLPAPGGAQSFQGTVRDRISKAPLGAFLQVNEGGRVLSDPSTGEFEIHASWDQGELRIFHPKYQSQVLELTRSDLGLIELEPSIQTRITAVDEFGTPLAGVECTMTALLTNELEGHATVPHDKRRVSALGRTDGRGQLVAALTEACVILGRDQSGRLSAARANPASTVELLFLGSPRTLRVIDAVTEKPIAKRAFPVSWTVSGLQAGYSATTDDSGTILLPSGAGQLEIAKSAPRGLVRILRTPKRLVAKAGGGGFTLRGELLTQENELSLLVDIDEHDLQLVHARSGEPIDGDLWYQTQRYSADPPRWVSSDSEEPAPVVKGRVSIDGWFARPNHGEHAEKQRRWLAVPGFEVAILPSSRDLRGATLRLEPAQERTLFVTDQEGRPLQTMIRLEFGGGARALLYTDASGLAGTFPWSPGQDWALYCPLIDQETPRIDVEASKLAAWEILHFRLPVTSGSIHVQDVPPDGPPLYAASDKLFPKAATYSAEGALFEGLPAGDYAIGSLEYVSHVVRRGQSGWHRAQDEPTSPLHVPVTTGETTEIGWNSDWFAGSALRGQVLVGNEPGTGLAILPIYGNGSTKLFLGREMPWRYTDSKGYFSTDPTAPRPAALLFARPEFDPFGLGQVVLDVQPIREDGQYALALTSIELSCKNSGAETPMPIAGVHAEGSKDGLTVPLQVNSGLWPFEWDPAEPLLLEGLPANIDRVEIRVLGQRAPIVVPVTAGSFTKVKVTLPLPSLQKPEGPALHTD